MTIRNPTQAWRIERNRDIFKMGDKKEKKDKVHNELLRLSTAGSVDDGKSTLIGLN